MKRPTSRQSFNIRMVKIAICFLVSVLAIAVLYFTVRRAELSSVEQEEIRGDLSNRFLPEKGIELNGGVYTYRDGIKLLSVIVLNQNEDMPINSPPKKQVNLIGILVIDSKNKVLYPIQIDCNTIIDSIYLEADSKSTEKVRIADVFNEERNEQGCENITKALGKLFFGLEIKDYMSLNSNLLTNKLDYKQSIKELIGNGRLMDIMSNKDNSIITNIKSDRMLSIFLSIQSMKWNDIIVLEGEEKIDNNGLVEFHIDDKKLAELAIEIMLEPYGNDG